MLGKVAKAPPGDVIPFEDVFDAFDIGFRLDFIRGSPVETDYISPATSILEPSIPAHGFQGMALATRFVMNEMAGHHSFECMTEKPTFLKLYSRSIVVDVGRASRVSFVSVSLVLKAIEWIELPL